MSTPTGISALPPAEISFQLQDVTYMSAAILAILCYDYLLTVGYEVKYMWKHEWGIGKVLFFLVWYPVFIDATAAAYFALCTSATVELCRGMFYFSSWSLLLGVFSCDAILLLRTYALWNRSRNVLYFLLFTFVAMMGTCCAIIGTTFLTLQISPPSPNTPGCVVYFSSSDFTSASNPVIRSFVIVVSLIMLFETTVVCLTIFAGILKWRHSSNSIFRVIQQDGILYFISTLSISVGIIILIQTLPAFVSPFSCLYRIMHCIVGGRIQFHLRDTYNKDSKLPLGWYEWSSAANRIVFKAVIPKSTENGKGPRLPTQGLSK